MPRIPAHRSRRGDTAPTVQIPTIVEGPGRHSATRDRSGPAFVPLLLVAAVAAVVLGLLFAYVVFGSGHHSGAPTAVATGPGSDEQLLPTEAAPSESATPSPSASSVPSASPRRTQNPSELIDQLQSTFRGLPASTPLGKNVSKELGRRLQEADRAIANGDIATARARLTEFANSLAVLRQEGKIASADYQDLTAIINQLAQALSRP